MYPSIMVRFLAAMDYVAPIPKHINLMSIIRVYLIVANHQRKCCVVCVYVYEIYTRKVIVHLLEYDGTLLWVRQKCQQCI